MGPPDILNSKIKEIKIELPGYRFSHSASGDSSHPFIGRERTRETLKKLITDSPDEPSVYLIAGNRGVGKTSLISEVIKETSLQKASTFRGRLKDLFDIKKYIKHRNRLFLRINFGHKLKDEKDILRLVTSTLSTEYGKHRRSLWRMWPWRVIALVALVVFAYLPYAIVNEQKIDDKQYLKIVLSNTDTTKTITKTKIGDTVEITVKTKLGTNVVNPLYMLKQFVSVIKKGIETVVDIVTNTNLIPQILKDYLFWLSFLVTYLFSVLLFRSNWITHFFITHRVIARRLKKLTEDITHSTERENSISVSNSVIGAKTKKSRSVADAREIEKRLQDILDDMRRIPRVMCRPQVVIVFDELDKVEPGDAGLEKEVPQTKATMFSIGATREKQTEILRILSNMKYFLSTARAKFIFIAGSEMFDIHLADVSERNNYIGSIFNAVIHVPSLLADHPTSKGSTREESGMASLPEEFVCRRLFPRKYKDKVKAYNLKSYRKYLEEKIFCEEPRQENEVSGQENAEKIERMEKIEKIIAVLQQFIIYLAHVSKGAPKKMIQLFETFVEIRAEKDRYKKENTLLVSGNRKSGYFLTFDEHKQYTVGLIAYLITPIFNRLAESNVNEHSDKLLVSSLRFIDFLFKFHKHPFSWWHLDISPELLEVNRAPELKSVTEDLLKYLTRVHIDDLTFCYSIYKFNSLIAGEISAMTKTDAVLSALFSFSLDETLPLKEHFKGLLKEMEKEYQNQKETSMFIDAASSLQVVLGDLYYYDDEIDQAQVYYNKAVQGFRWLEQKNGGDAKEKDDEVNYERFYLYIRNMFRLGMIYEKRKHYESAYIIYGELCRRIIRERYIAFQELGIDIRKGHDGKNVFVKTSDVTWIRGEEKRYSDNIEVQPVGLLTPIQDTIASLQPLNFGKFLPQTYDMMFKRMTYEGLRTLYLPFIVKLQIVEKSHVGGITRDHLDLLEKEYNFLTFIINHNDAKILEAEFYTRVADILYYKNADLKNKKNKNRKTDNDEDSSENPPANISCTACHYYHKALSALLRLNKSDDNDTVIGLLRGSVEQISGSDDVNMKFYTILARILSDWGNVFFSCDNDNVLCGNSCRYICEINCYMNQPNTPENICEKYINFMESEENNSQPLFDRLNQKHGFTKMEIVFAMYSISTVAYRKANQYKPSAYQLYKMLSLFKHYEIPSTDYITPLSEKAINYLWCANDDLNEPELNKRKKDLGRVDADKETLLPYLLVNTEITKIRILVKELELKSVEHPEELKCFYEKRITSPYKINYSLVGRIYQLRLKSKVNYEAYQQFLKKAEISEDIRRKENFILKKEYCEKLKNVSKDTVKDILGIDISVIDAIENLIAESIYCLIDISRITKTMGETNLFSHSFLGSVHEDLSFWIRQYEEYETYKGETSNICKYLERYLDKDWRDLLSGYRETRQAISRYSRCLETHSGGGAYHDMIDGKCYVRDDFNDHAAHFNTAEERHLIVKGEIQAKVKALKALYKDSKLYKAENYYYTGKASQ